MVNKIRFLIDTTVADLVKCRREVIQPQMNADEHRSEIQKSLLLVFSILICAHLRSSAANLTDQPTRYREVVLTPGELIKTASLA
jgi:hypothetical protein